MAKQGNWNKSFWKKLNSLGELPQSQIRQIMLEETGKLDALMVEKTPYRYGGLLWSHYSIVTDTPSGVSAKFGYTNKPHLNNDPANPHYDTITNPELAEMLIDKNKTSEQMLDIADAIYDTRENIKTRVYKLLKNGGK